MGRVRSIDLGVVRLESDGRYGVSLIIAAITFNATVHISASRIRRLYAWLGKWIAEQEQRNG